MEAHPTIAAEQEGASHSFVGYNVHPNCMGRGRCAVVVELDGHSDLSVSAEQLSGSETTPRSGRCRSDAGRVSSARGDHLIKGSLMDEGLRRSCVQEGAAVKPRRRGDSTMERQ